MKKEITEFPGAHILGLKTRTNNRNEMSPETAKIGPCAHQFMTDGLPDSLPLQSITNTVFCVYTDYESDYTGDYTFVIGKQIAASIPINPSASAVLPKQKYVKFTTEPGPIPQVVIAAWMQIWQMDEIALGGRRTYQADFEVYDERATDSSQATIDIYVGIE